MPHTQWIKGRHLVTFVPRTLDDIRALDDGRIDEHGFEVVNRISVINQHIYDFAISPVVRALSTVFNPQCMRALHPNSMENYLWSILNPISLYTQMSSRTAKQARVSIAESN